MFSGKACDQPAVAKMERIGEPVIKERGGRSWKQRLTPSGEDKRVSVTGGMSSQCVGPHSYYTLSTKIPIPLAMGVM